MSPMRIIIIVIGLAAAIGAALMLRTVISDDASAANEFTPQIVTEVEIPEVEVLVALRDLRVGETLSFEDLAWASWPEESTSPSHIIKTNQPDALDEMTGAVVRIPIFEREPLLPQKVVDRGDSSIMASLVGPGMRAVSLEISAETASGGFILPNDRVDVILTHDVELQTANGTTDEVQSVIILENVRVLAIDQGTSSTEGATSIGRTATLELSPQDAALIGFGQRKGQLSLSLRSLSDAALAGDVVTSRAAELRSTSSGGRVTVFRNGRVRETSAGIGE